MLGTVAARFGIAPKLPQRSKLHRPRWRLRVLLDGAV